MRINWPLGLYAAHLACDIAPLNSYPKTASRIRLFVPTRKPVLLDADGSTHDAYRLQMHSK